MPIVSIDWAAIVEKAGGETVLVAMTDRQLSLLNSLSAQLQWRKTFRVEDFDFAEEYDTVLSEVDDLGVHLNMPVYLTDLIQALADIKAGIDALDSVQDYCCQNTDPTTGEQYIDYFNEGSPGEVPQALVDAGIATDTSDWGGFEEYQCAIAHGFVSDLKRLNSQYSDLFDIGGQLIVGIGALATLAGVIAFVATGGAAALVIGILAGTATGAGLFASLNGLGEDNLPTETDFEDHRQDLVCAWINAAHDGFDDRLAAFHQALSDNFTVLQAAYLQQLAAAWRWRPLYQGSYDDRNIAQELINQGWAPGDYSCECAQLYDCDLSLVPDCSFESQSLDYGWAKTPAAIMPLWIENAQHGTVSIQLDGGTGGSGHPDRLVYCDMVPNVTGVHTVRFWAYRMLPTYATYIEVYRIDPWQLVSPTMVPPLGSGWVEAYYEISLIQGVSYQVRMGGGAYFLIDHLRIWPK